MLGVPGGGGRRTRGSCALGNDDTATLGALLRGHRERRGLSQEELAALVDPPLSVTTVGNLERGRTRPYRHTLEALCCALALTEEDRARLFAAWRGAVPVTAAPVALRALEAGRAAVSRRDWQAGFERLSAADAEGQLTAGDLEALGEAALWSGHPQESIDARQRAHAAYSRGGDRRGAARAALGLVVNNVIRLSPAVAAGWFQKAQRLLEGEPESVEHGLLAWTTAVVRLRSMDDLEGGLASARTAFEIGRRLGDEDVQAVALTAQGYALVRLGRRAEGLACLDEAMASAVAGGLGPFAAGYVYCWTLSTCVDLFDYRRALEWTDAIHQCAGAGGTAGYPGDCRVHKAAVLVVRGAWAEGEREALVACDECATFDLRHAAMATYAIGEIRLRRGDLAGAERAFREAHELGASPHPGLALLRLAQGDAPAAAGAITAALSEAALDRLAVARLLPAQVEIALATGDPETASSAAAELAEIAATYGSTALQAAAACARGAVQLESGEPEAAVPSLRQGIQLWRQVDAPYSIARARVLLARALDALGDRDTSTLEREAARSAFARLGAEPDARLTGETDPDVTRGWAR